MPHTLMSLEDAADYLHLDIAAVRSLAVHGELPSEMQGDRLVFRRGPLQSWASQRILGLRGKHLAEYHSRGVLRQHDTSPRAAILSDLTDPEFMEPVLQARSKAAVMRALTTVAERTGYLYDPDDLLESIRQREELCSTGIEGGAAILHPRHHDPYMFDDSFVCIGRSPVLIPFGATDGSKTDVFFLVCCQDDSTHLHVLARICLLVHGSDILSRLRAAHDGREMYAALTESEAALLARAK